MKKLVISLVAIAALLALLAFIYREEVVRAGFAASLFSGAEQYENFNRVADVFPTTTMIASPTPYEFPQGTPTELPASFTYKNQETKVTTFLAETDTAALLVLKDGAVVHEHYSLTGGPEVNWLSMSVAKSFISTGIGIAVDEGLIDIHSAIDQYVPILTGSAYEGVRIKDVLQMSSGAAWDETYSDPNSEINRLGRVLALGGSTSEFVAQMQREFEPGTVNRYNSADTQALGLLLTYATGKSVTGYLTEKIWHPLGMQDDAYWIIDSENIEMAFFGLNATARDYTKLGELFRNNGQWHGKRIVAQSWVRDATTPDAPHLMPKSGGDFPFGYGYQWWVPQSSEGEFMAVGVYNQFIYVNPTRGVVITKLSAFSDYATSDDESAYREVETLALFREIARAL